VYQLIRATTIVFVALYRVFLLGEKFHSYQWAGVGLNTLAVTLVGASAFFDPTAGSNVPLGISVLILGCAIMASQLVLEEKVMSGDNTPPLVVVGMEGFWGSLIMVLIMFPLAYYAPGGDLGSYENLPDSLVMIRNNDHLLLMCFLYLLAITCYNVCAIFITSLLESVWRAILENFRPIAVWSTDLVLFYLITNRTFGEEWTVWCWLELAGMCLLLYGTAVYNGSIRHSCFTYPEFEDDDKVTATATMETHMQSPLIVKSPAYLRKKSSELRAINRGQHKGYGGAYSSVMQTP
jgi:drug/metabolite transporter (DMT)-like permease